MSDEIRMEDGVPIYYQPPHLFVDDAPFHYLHIKDLKKVRIVFREVQQTGHLKNWMHCVEAKIGKSKFLRVSRYYQTLDQAAVGLRILFNKVLDYHGREQ